MRPGSVRLSLATITAFDHLYSQIPSIDCKGLCHDSCGMVPMTEFEWKRMVARHGKVPGVRKVDESDGRPWCPFLTPDNRCQHHDIRPVLCRAWGVTEGMPCVHGCLPAKMLTDDEAKQLLAVADRIGGGPVPDQMEIIFAAIKPGK